MADPGRCITLDNKHHEIKYRSRTIAKYSDPSCITMDFVKTTQLLSLVDKSALGQLLYAH